MGLASEREETLVDEAREQIEDVEPIDRFALTHRLGGLDRERGREDRESPEQSPFPVLQQLVAPLDGSQQGALALHRAPRTTCEQAEPLVEPVGEVDRWKNGEPRRGQLDGHRKPVEAIADPRDRRR